MSSDLIGNEFGYLRNVVLATAYAINVSFGMYGGSTHLGPFPVL